MLNSGRIFLMALGSVLSLASHAQPLREMALREGTFACGQAQAMNLWELAAGSPLIRHDMVQRNHCWRLMPGLKVLLIGPVGKFSQVQFPGSGAAFFVYTADLRKWTVPPERRATSPTSLGRDANVVVSVKNSGEFGVVLIQKRPSVEITVAAGPDVTIEFSVVKEVIQSGFSARVTDQKGPSVQVGGKVKKAHIGLGGGDDYAQIKFLQVNLEKGYAEIEVEGHWADVASTNLTLRPSVLKITGRKFIELVRPHTTAELEKVLN